MVTSYKYFILFIVYNLVYNTVMTVLLKHFLQNMNNKLKCKELLINC